MVRVTRLELEALILPGHGIAVEYIHPDIAQAGIQWWGRGKAAHFLCALGGLGIVEADVQGVTHSNLDNYLRGNTVLKVYRVRPNLTPDEQRLVCARWMDEVNQSYGWGSVLRGGVTTGIRRIVHPWSPMVARLLLRVAARLMGHQPPDCSALWVDAVKHVRPGLFVGFDPEDVTPEIVVRHRGKDLELVATLDRAVLAPEDR